MQSHRTPPPLSRRQWGLTVTAAAAAGALATGGCTGSLETSAADLVWGRRGFSQGRFQKPRAIAIDARDQLYIVDTTGRIQVFDADGGLQRMWKTPHTANGRPTGLAVDRENRLLVADTHYYRLLVYTLEGELLEDQMIGGERGTTPGLFAFVTDAVRDSKGNYYIGDYGAADRVQRFDPEGRFVNGWGGTGRDVGQFVRPQSLSVDDADQLWVCDACNHRIQVFDVSRPDAPLVRVFGKEGSGPGEFYYPYDLALARDGTLYVCEYGNQRIQHVTAAGEPLGFWGAPGRGDGQLYQPWGLVRDSQDRLHILDSNNHRVQRVVV